MIRMGVIGGGTMGAIFARLIAEHHLTELVGICDRDKNTAASLAAEWKVPGKVDAEELFDVEGINAVYIATPDFAHTDLVLEAIDRGLHVLVEKPLTMSLNEAMELEKRLNETQLKGMVRFGNRFSPPFSVVKNAIASGRHGQVISMKGFLNDSIIVPTKMLSWSERTTPGWFLLSHVLDLAYWFVGSKVTGVYANGIKSKLLKLGIDTYDTIQISVQYENGAIGQFESTWVLPESIPQIFDMGFEVVCEDGTFKVNTHEQMVISMADKYTYPSTLMTEVTGKLQGYLKYSLDAFVDCIMNGEKPSPIPFADGVENVRVLEALHRSLETGQVVSLTS